MEKRNEIINNAIEWLNENERIRFFQTTIVHSHGSFFFSHKIGSEIGLVLAPKSLGNCLLLKNDPKTAANHL